jgi:NAD(P)-dependent dehydrogenase (short-subunit alcohol dehydrogenase family)
MFVGITEAYTAAEYARQLDINVVGVHRVNRAFLPSMRAKGSGLIVNVSSVARRMAMPFFGIYCASKWALEGYTQGMRVELAHSGVDTVLVEPGPFATELFGQAPAPADLEQRGAGYPDSLHQAWAGMSQNFESIFASPDTPTDSSLVVDVFEQLADATPGSRPLRIAVGLDFGVHERNRVAVEHDAQLLAAFQMEELARLKTA